MLIELFGENFGCFREEFRLSMLAADIDPVSDRGIVEVQLKVDPEPLRLLRAVGIYGPNASGKSTVLRAARALHRLIFVAGRFRSDELIPVYEPFASEVSAKLPTRLGVKAVIDGEVYDYEVTFNDHSVLTERLDRQLLENTDNLFTRQGQHVDGTWTSDERFRLIGEEFRPNALLLSLADSLTPGLAGKIAVSLARLLRFHDASATRAYAASGDYAARRASEDSEFRGWLLAQLRAADVGVAEMRVKRLRRVTHEQGILFDELPDDDESPTEPTTRFRLSFAHAGPQGAFQVPYANESFGTRKLIDLAPILYDVRNRPMAVTAFVDEIGASLHPTLLSELIRQFNCEQRPISARGQLVFSTHETSLMDDEAKNAILRRDQVYFTEKDSSGVARLYSLADFKERNNLNLRKRYLEGRYGAIPALGRFPR